MGFAPPLYKNTLAPKVNNCKRIQGRQVPDDPGSVRLGGPDRRSDGHPHCGGLDGALSHQAATTVVTGAGQSPRDPCTPKLGEGPSSQNPPQPLPFGRRGGAKVSQTRRPRPGVNLRRALRVGSWNILSLSQDE
ncbi:MAG: hypothetical protein GY938_05405 [Ketobacter sp.]|nr:hypothetical protein [Ketobacter sp.]